MIVTDSPRDQDLQFKKIGSSQEGKNIKSILSKSGIDLNTIFFTSIIKCKCVGNIPVDSIRACSEYIEAEIAEHKPQVIILLGDKVIKAFGIEGKVSEVRGAERWSEKYQCYLLPTYGFFYVSNYNQHAPVYKAFVADMIKGYKIATEGTPKKLEVNYTLVTTIEEAIKAKNEILSTRWYSSDTETTSLDFRRAELVWASFSNAIGRAWSIPYKHPKVFNTPTGQREIHAILKELWESDRLKIFHNAKFDIKVIWHHGIDIKKVAFDTMLAHYMIDENSPHKLDFLASTLTDIGAYKDEVGKYIKGEMDIEEEKDEDEEEEDTIVTDGDKVLAENLTRESTILDVPLDMLHLYACRDTDATFRLKHVFEPMLESMDMTGTFAKIMMPMCYILSKMEYRGIKTDKAYLIDLNRKYQQDYEEYSARIQGSKTISMWRNRVKTEIEYEAEQKNYTPKKLEKLLKEKTVFNLNSSYHKRKLFYDILELPITERTKVTKAQRAKGKTEGSPKTDAPTLKILLDKHKYKILGDFLAYNKVKKFREYVIKYLKLSQDDPDGIVHTEYGQHTTVTARLSSKNPNWQNIPKRGEEVEGEGISKAMELRNAIVARYGYTLLEADFSSAEMFIWAACSKDAKLYEFLTSRNEDGSFKDIHKQIYSKIYNIPIDKVDKNQRNFAKTICYGVMYGRGSWAISKATGEDEDLVKRFIRDLFKDFPVAMSWIESQPVLLQKQGYVTSAFNRRRRIQTIYSQEDAEREEAKRQAMNFPIQSGASDASYKGIINIYKQIQQYDAHILLQIHDSVVLEIKDEKLQEVIPIVKFCMENAIIDMLPMRSSIELGKRLGEMVEEEEYFAPKLLNN